MCWTALPQHINEPNEWDNKDDDRHWYTSWRKAVKGWFAYGPRDIHWYHRWRKNPITLLAIFGKGESRWENDILAIRSIPKTILFYNPGNTGFYLSRVQYWCNWSFQIQWPFFIGFHWYYGKTNKQGVQLYIGTKRDADKVYWFPAIFLGRTWK